MHRVSPTQGQAPSAFTHLVSFANSLVLAAERPRLAQETSTYKRMISAQEHGPDIAAATEGLRVSSPNHECSFSGKHLGYPEKPCPWVGERISSGTMHPGLKSQLCRAHCLRSLLPKRVYTQQREIAEKAEPEWRVWRWPGYS